MAKKPRRPPPKSRRHHHHRNLLLLRYWRTPLVVAIVAAAAATLGVWRRPKPKEEEKAPPRRRRPEVAGAQWATLMAMGDAAYGAGKFEEAVSSYREALRLAPQLAAAHANLASALSRLDRVDEALDAAREGFFVSSLDSEERAAVLVNMGTALVRKRRVLEAWEAFEAARRENNESLEARHYASRTATSLGFLDSALSAAREAVGLDNTHEPSWLLLAAMGEENVPEDRLFATFEAKRKKDEDAAWRAIVEANERVERRKEPPATVVARAIVEMFPSPPAEPCDRGIVFLVGPPRAGRTLLHAALSRHPDVSTDGHVRTLLNDAIADLGPTAAARNKTLLKAYLDDMPPGRRFAIDANLVNIWWLGVLAELLGGKLRIVLLDRAFEPLAFSCFKTHFSSSSSGFDWAYDPRALSDRLAAINLLSDHWRRVFPRATITTLNFDDFLSHPEPTLRRLLAWLELDWDPSCLEPHKAEVPLDTPAALAVRTPGFRPPNSWQPYANRLARLMANDADHHPKVDDDDDDDDDNNIV
ncbi:hypothetical protein CTAYLR_000652 [Chrysophaeum taylorii]|uniref:protein-tyrosine sulfotransferase n=1 Tax=Chrysophaeum taylorii TaxID=2483200 RepID=A0AAD7U8R0_9STRA|nr:hypothetical protein CTAYLR_000652 [Chrysophaeum taylorii]